MSRHFDLALPAHLIGEPARAHMLTRLLDGAARTAGELAREAGITPQTASAHLAQLLEGGLVQVAAQGRHRYYRLAGPEVARALEALSLLTPAARAAARVPEPLRFARTCYDHLAGKLAVDLVGALERKGHLAGGEDAYALTAEGERYFAHLGVDLERLARGKRAFARPCLDWSERRPHLAGALGAALAECLFERKWVARAPEGRGVRLTVTGRQGFERDLGLAWA
ncbi:winged helix-turn-helix transcriptional regulator [Aggregicoccus sp. 17bor-14]|uniref:ArsR/SmtB family transcription factor n=1 Tax=Myxococcaceae TaxID=31 RepID=UPI00129CA72A|nr:MULTISPECIES: winged helix-turn-helix domain-containing protein [Myxococcaceae]MBF5043424.1 winged helix-turn-helix transcriptional regulator [Simulacricoccus sp. 17bor-14]MRI89182.1 winged helix-turn-helix transcriptional regulator [Aggregicoccus sp. 17bor-14]